MTQANEDRSCAFVQVDNSIIAQAEYVCEPRAEPRPASGIGRVVDPTTLLVVEPGGLARCFMLFFAGAATSRDGLVPDQLGEEAEDAEPFDVGKARRNNSAP